jgi:hypothetical protein
VLRIASDETLGAWRAGFRGRGFPLLASALSATEPVWAPRESPRSWWPLTWLLAIFFHLMKFSFV